MTFVLAKDRSGVVNLSVGTSFERFQTQFPAARTESANAMVTTLRYHRRVEGSAANQQEWDAGYSLRAATNILGSDFAYARHLGDVQYAYSWGRNQILDDLTAGAITDRRRSTNALYSVTAPCSAGGTLLNSIRWAAIAWCTTRWSTGTGSSTFSTIVAQYGIREDGGLRHSVGIGIRQNGIYAALAFPVSEGHIEPVFMVGMNY